MAQELYPRVQFTTRALQRRRATAVRSNATRLLVPFLSDRGPEREIVEIDNFTNFTATFGSLSYKKHGQEQILNIGQWLDGGGIICALRVTEPEAAVTEFSGDGKEVTIENASRAYSVTAKAKYSGSYYDRLKINVSVNANGSINILIRDSANSLIERYNGCSVNEIYKYIKLSEYIGELKVLVKVGEADAEEATPEAMKELYATLTSGSARAVVEFNLTSSTASADITGERYDELLISTLEDVLKQPLETPMDSFIDCGYSAALKGSLATFFKERRPDIYSYFTPYVIVAGKVQANSTMTTSELSAALNPGDEFYGFAVVQQYCKVVDMYSAEGRGSEIYVPSLYFLARMIPFNDANVGIQYATAGKKRALIGSELLWINEIYSNAEKDELYKSGINYIEKDQDGYAFMTNLTFTTQDTTLKFINHERVVLKIQQQLGIIGRNYLHEQNDSITKKSLENSLNNYLDGWIQNRTLQKESTVEVYDSTENESLENEEILIALYLKFVNSVEIISVEITCE